MPRGDKSAYTDKQKRKAQHIEEGYRERGVPDTKVSSKRGGRLGGKAAARRPAAAKSRSAKKAAATRKRRTARR